MSSRTQYDPGESRRSPRDRSPGRYNDLRDSDQYRGGANRGGERRRSISDSRTSNHNAFASNRDNFRDPIGRESSRDLPPREPPRGPKALVDPPSGPRSSNYGGEYRGDFGGYRGDFRGSRGGRGRGRGGGWRDDWDRGREAERDYRGPRDDRGPPPFRDDRSRDRERWERNDSFRGRRASSPQARGRSPNFAPRETRDIPSNLELDRARRGSRDVSLSGGSPASDSLQPPGFIRGFGRGRGTRGRGRGGYYEEYHRNPSPDPNRSRRTQPSATPPPQVPAFGSASANMPVPSTAPKAPVGPALDLVPGVNVPTAPRGHSHANATTAYGRSKDGKVTSARWINPELAAKGRPTDVQSLESVSTASGTKPSPPTEPIYHPDSPRSRTDGRERESKSAERLTEQTARREKDLSPRPRADPESKSPPRESRRKRRAITGKRAPEIPAPLLHEITDDGSDSDYGDDFEDDFVEDDIKQAEEDMTRAADENHNPFNPREEPDAYFLKPFIDWSIDQNIVDDKSAAPELCIPAEPLKEPTPESRNKEEALKVKPTSKRKSRPTTPLIEPEAATKPKANGRDVVSQLEAQASANLPVPTIEPQIAPSIEIQASSSHGGPDLSSADPKIKSEVSAKPAVNGKTRKSAPMDTFDESEDEPEPEPIKPTEKDILAVRKMMTTPPLSSLPKYNCKKWHEDQEFLKTLEPDPAVEVFIRNKLREDEDRRSREQEQERQAWKERYYEYRRWTDFSDDPIAVRSREKFAKSRDKRAAEAAALLSATPAPGSKPEPQRRTGRFATEHDFERVLRESEQEARETKEREERVTRARTASAKEATIPDMCWDEAQRLATMFIDKTHLVPFERSFAILQFGEPIDNFTEEEREIFEKAYLETPKQWGKIAEAMPQRDYKACIQHYYLVKRDTQLKEKAKKFGKRKRKNAPKGAKAKSSVLVEDTANRDEGDDGADAENGGERRRPRRAAAPTFSFEATPADSEAPSPAPTPGRKAASTPKGDMSNDGAPPPKKRTKVPREKGTKQSKNSQLLAAAPTSASRGAESPGTQTNTSARSGSSSANRFPPQYDGASGMAGSFVPNYTSVDRPNPAMTGNFDVMSQTFAGPERLGSAPPMNFETQQNRQSLQQTSSYWSVPEQNDFPALLRHFGTDWGAIARFMTSKTHVMVYTTVFQQWLAVPSDSNKSRRVANIQTQVKNYYQRQVESGKMSAWEQIARDADGKKERGESTGPLPTPTIIPKRRMDGPQSTIPPRSGSAVDGIEDMASSGQNMTMHRSPPQPSLSARFPALAVAGPVPQPMAQPATSASLQNKHVPQQPVQPVTQQMQPQPRPPRGPALGYFHTDPQRPIMQATNTQHAQSTPPMPPMPDVSQRSLMVAQEAQIERQEALRLEREQVQAQVQAQAQAQAQARAQQQAHQQALQKHAMERERQLQMKQEIDTPNLHQYEPYPTPSVRSGNTVPHSRPEVPQTIPQAELRRTAPPQQYQPRNHQAVRSLLGENTTGGREMKSSPSPAIPRAPMSAPPASQEQFAAPPPAPVAAVRQQETVRKTSSIMSLLNDEPSEPRPLPPKRVSDVTSTPLQTSQTPPPHHSRYAHPSQASSQPPQQMSQQMPPQMPPHQQPPQSQHPYAPASQHPLHQHSSSVGQPRSYTPNSFEHRAYAPPPSMQQQPQQPQQQPQSMYSQPPRQSMGSQPPPIRREPSLGEIHGASGYARASAPSQSSMRLKESPYTTTPPPAQAGRQQLGSPHDLAHPAERGFYSRPPEYSMQQQPNSAGSPQLGPSYQPQSQQQQSSHRQLAFGQGLSHTASPPTQYAAQHSLHRSRQNSFDGRFPTTTSSTPTPQQQGYIQTQHQGAPMSMPYQQQHPGPDRFESSYERDRRMQEEAHQRQRLEDQQRMEESRRRGY